MNYSNGQNTTITSQPPLEQSAASLEVNDSTGWDIAKQATALRKNGDIDGAIKLAKEALAQLPDFEPLQSSLSWALYTRDIKSLGEELSLDELRQGWRTCKQLRELLKADLYGEYSAWIPSVLTVSSAMLSHANGNTSNMLRAALGMLQEMDVGQLSTEGYAGRPSSAERYCLGLTKAFHRLHEWEQLRHSCESALKRLPSGGDTELWLRHRLGTACLELGDAQSAIPHLAFVVQRKPNEWWAHYNNGRAKFALGDMSSAAHEFMTALKGGTLHMKTHVMVDLARLLRSQGEVEVADRHHLVARHIRLEQGWPSTPDIDAPLEPDQVAAPEDLRRLKQLWDELTLEERRQGRVRTVFESGSSGFLELENGENVYFTMNRDQLAPEKGTCVTCQVVDSYDKKKQQASKKAIDVREVRDQ